MVEPNATSTVFEMLEESFMQMMALSSCLKSQEFNNQAVIGHNQLYNNMLWSKILCHVYVFT